MNVHCDSCAAVVINGTPCHEHGCPDEYIDLRTGRGKLVPCFECGNDFRAGDRSEYRNRRRVCTDCIAAELGDAYDDVEVQS